MFTRSIIGRTLAGIGLCVLGATASSQAQETLKYKWNKGDVLFYRANQETTTKQSVMGMERTWVKKEEMVQRFEVKDVTADGVATVDVSVVSVKIEDDQGGAVASLDTSRAADKQYEGPPRRKATMDYMGGLVGEHYTAQIDQTGAVRKVEGMSKIIDKMISRVGAADPRIANNLRATFGDEATRGALDRTFKVLPDRPVKEGETWTTSYEQQTPGVGGKMKLDTTTTFAGMEKVDAVEVAKFTGVLVIDDVPLKEGEPAPPAKTTITDGKGTSVCMFDPKGGKLVKSTLEMMLPIEASLAGNSNQPGVTVKNDTTSKYTFENIPEPPASDATEAPSK